MAQPRFVSELSHSLKLLTEVAQDSRIQSGTGGEVLLGSVAIK